MSCRDHRLLSEATLNDLLHALRGRLVEVGRTFTVNSPTCLVTATVHG